MLEILTEFRLRKVNDHNLYIFINRIAFHCLLQILELLGWKSPHISLGGACLQLVKKIPHGVCSQLHSQIL